jgi:multiple sugar transport system substrate-binding protein
MNTFQTVLSIIFGVALVVAVLIFSGVLPGFRSTTSSAAQQITIWGTLPGRTLQDYWLEFNKASEGVVAVTYIEKPATTFESELVEALASSKGPDAVIMDQSLLEKHREKIYPLPYESFTAREFKDTFIQGGELFLGTDGAYALPVLVDPLVMYYNRDVLNASGWSEPPKVWSDFVAPTKPLTLLDEKGNVTRSALAMGTYGNVNHAKEIIALLLLQAGNPLTSHDANGDLIPRLGDNLGYIEVPAEAAVSFYNQFADPTKTTYSWNNAQPSAEEAFIGGTLATYLGYASELDNLRAKNSHLNLDVTIVPQRDRLTRVSYGQIYAVAVMKTSPKVMTALQAALIMSQKTWSGALSKALDLPPARRDLLGAGNLDPFPAVFYAAALSAQSWLDPNPTLTNTVFREMIVGVATGKSKVNDAVTRADAELNAIINKR